MFVTLQQGPIKSQQGTFPASPGSEGSGVVSDAPQPLTPRIAHTDQRTGPNGGLLYNCSPRELVGSVMFSELGPFRFLERAEPGRPGPVVGVIASRLRPDLVELVHAGPVRAYRGLLPGRRYYLGPKGTLITTPLDRPDLLYVHYVGLCIYPDTLVVAPSFPLLKRSL